MHTSATPTPKPDRTAEFVRLLKRHDRRLSTYVHSLVPDWSEAEDLIQDTSVRLWEQFEQYDPTSDFGAWACAIAKYMVLAARKKSQRSHLYFRDEVLDAIGAEIDRAAPEVSDRMEALRHCISKLNDDARELLKQCYASGMRLKQVAGQLGRSAGSLYTAVTRIRQQLHECIEIKLRQDEH